MLAVWFAQIDLPSLDQQGPDGLRVLLDASFLLMPLGLLVGIFGHMAGIRTIVGIGIALVMVGTLLFMVAAAGYG